MASSPKLDLPTSPRTAVFRAMETIVRQNAIFNRVVKPDRFRTWEGHPRDIKPFSYQEAPCMRWTPMNGPEMFATPSMIKGDLLINCEVIIAGSCCDDLTNFWWMLDEVLLPGSGGLSTDRSNAGSAGCTLRARDLHPTSVRPLT